MQVTKLAEGLWRWTAPHPDWTPASGKPGGWEQMVGCTYYEPPAGVAGAGALVLIDPLAPPEGTPEAEKFWKSLDGDVARLARPVVILLGNHFHSRSAQAVMDRYRRTVGASILAHEAAAHQVPCELTRTFRHGQVLPGGVVAHEAAGLSPDETVFRLPPHGALVFADALLGTGSGRVQVPRASWAPDSTEAQQMYREALRPSLRRLLELRGESAIRMLLVSHGEPVLSGGREALKAALDAPAWGE